MYVYVKMSQSQSIALPLTTPSCTDGDCTCTCCVAFNSFSCDTMILDPSSTSPTQKNRDFNFLLVLILEGVWFRSSGRVKDLTEAHE